MPKGLGLLRDFLPVEVDDHLFLPGFLGLWLSSVLESRATKGENAKSKPNGNGKPKTKNKKERISLEVR